MQTKVTFLVEYLRNHLKLFLFVSLNQRILFLIHYLICSPWKEYQNLLYFNDVIKVYIFLFDI